MASSPVKFFSVFLVASAVGWVVFTFASRMLAWFLSRVMSASVSFRVAGFNCLRDVNIKFRKGSIECASVGEIKLSFRKSLVKLGVSVISKDPKLQLLISDIELVMRSSGQSKKTAKSRKSSSTGKGKWFVITSAARFLSVWVTDLVVKVPKAGIEVKELKLDIFKIAGPNQSLEVKLHVVPLSLQFGDYGFGMDAVCHNQPDCSQSDQAFPVVSEKSPAPFICDAVMVTCNFGHEKEKGVRIKNLDLTCGDVMVNLDESLLSKSSANADKNNTDFPGATGARKSGKSKAVLSAIKKQVYALPEKVSFSVPKLDAKFMHLGERITIENNITGIQLSSVKLPSHDETGEATSHFDVQLDFSEIHLVREGGTSFLEILKVATVASIDVPVESDLPIRAEVDAKLGGTQCNLDVSRLMPWMHLYMSRSKGMNLAKQSSHTESPQTNGIKGVMWTCTLSAPEMTIMFYSLNGVVLYHGCSQSSHLFANNIASKGIQINTELGEIQLHMEDEYREFVKENVFGVDAYSGSLLNISRLSFDWGYHEVEMQENPDLSPWAVIFSVDISGMVVQFGSKHIESLLLNLLSFKTLFKSLSSSVKKSAGKSSAKKKPRGTKIFKLNMEKCSISYAGETSVLETAIADPKRVNFGSQGGEVIISVSADGTPRKASILSDLGDCKSMKFSTSLVVSHLTACLDKEKESTQIELQRAKSVFEEYPEENKPSVKVTLFDLQNAKVIKRSGRVADFAMCMFFSATDIAVQWDLDAYLALYESFARFKSMLRNMNPKVSENKMNSESAEVKSIGLNKDSSLGKGESIIAVDVEVLNVTAELADGVTAKLYVQSIFTENVKIGLLMEGLVLRFNEARVLRSTRLQVSRIPSQKGGLTNPMTDLTSKRNWVVQGLDIYVCMPFRLPLRAIQDAIEDTVRGMKLIIAAKTSLIHPSKTQNPKKPGSSSSSPWSVRFVIRKLTAYIEEEPIQGWLDEHYHLMRKVACESDVRLRFLDEVKRGSGNIDVTGPIETEAFDMADVDKLKEEVHKKTFQSYYSACQKMVFSEGSGSKSCSIGYQAGFRPSLQRASLLSICGTELDVKLTKISGGNIEMVDFIKRLDSAAQEKNIPFSRFYGSDISVNAGSLVFQLRDYTFPLFAGTAGKCQGRIVFAQQATCFQPQIYQEIFIGRWHKVHMLRSASGTTPPVKMYSNLPIYFNRGEISFGVGYEPSFADISYAFQVALRKTNLSTRASKGQPVPPKKEKSLPWWDDMRYYIHGKIVLYFNHTEWNILATTNPYERLDKLQIVSDYMDITQTDGHVDISAKEFKMNISSLQSLMKNCSLRVPSDVSRPFIYSPNFSLNVIMDWECESGNPLNHYLHALPIEGEPRKRVLDPFRSTSLSLRWHFSLRPPQSLSEGIETIFDSTQKLNIHEFPTMNLGGHDLAWVFKWWGLNYSPPHKLRSFSRWPRFGIPRASRSGNLSLDKVMTEFCLRIDATPCCIKHVPLGEDDPASGLTFRMSKLRYELYYSRGKHKYTFESKRESLDLVYRGLDLHVPKVYLNQDVGLSPPEHKATMRSGYMSSLSDKQKDEGFLLSSDYFTIRRQAPKSDPGRLLAWQEAGRRNNLEMTYVRSEFENGSESDHTRSDPSDDDGFNVVIADNCQRVFVYGLKLLWTIENRDAVWSWVGAISKAFESPKPSPSRQYAQRKIMEEKQTLDALKTEQDGSNVASTSQGVNFNAAQVESVASTASPPATKGSSSFIDIPVRHGHIDDSDEEGTRHFMVNVIQPQFNLHSEEANGRFLLAAASGRVLARSFHSVLHVGYEMIEQALGETNLHIRESHPEMTWKRAELSVMLEHVQAHVAPTDVDPGAGLQWLPKILRGSDKLKRTGALLEQVFMPCQMYFRYTRHKGGTAELKVKPLKELSFNSPNITATMTSRQFQVMLDVLSNLLFARLPKPRKSSLVYLSEDDEDVEEEADEVVPDGVEEVELARINLEQRERERKLLLDDIRTLSEGGGSQPETCSSSERDSEVALWMVIGGKPVLVQALKKELVSIRKSRKAASSALRKALQKAAQVRLMEKEKNKSPSCAMRISMCINKVVWSMLADGKTFAETEINDMIYDFDRDYKDIGVARFTTKSFVVRNCLPNAKSDMLLSAWNPPSEWAKNVMLRVDAKQGAPKDGHSPLELFQVEIYPLKIYLTETMYRMMWDYFFPEEEQDSQRRQEVWRVSTSAGVRKIRKSFAGSEGASTSTHSTKDIDVPGRLSATGATSSYSNSRQSGSYGENSQVSKLQSLKANMVCGSNPELRRSSSADKILEENVAENGTGDLILQLHSSGVPSKGVSANPTAEHFHALTESSKSNRPKDSNRSVRAGRLSHEEKKITKPQEEKRARSKKLMEFHNIKISQVELQVTYEGSRFAVNDLRLLMDTFHRAEFTGTWRRLFSKVKKHIIWGVLKSVTGMQGKKFKDNKAHNQADPHGGTELNLSDSDGDPSGGKADQFPVSWLKRPSDGAGDGFVTSIRGLFNSQRRKAKAFVLRTMRGDREDSEYNGGEWSESDSEVPFARQLTITKAKKLIKRHTKKFRSRGQKNSGLTMQQESVPSTPRETTPFQSESSGDSSYEDFHE